MAIAGGNITLDSTEGVDKITQTDKVTSPYFSDGNVNLGATNITRSQNLTSTNQTYFEGISKTTSATVEEFNVAFGSLNGFGSDDDNNAIKAPTEAIYKQYAGMLLAPTEVTGGFHISNQGSSGVLTARDSEIFIVSARRSNMKDRINKGTWQIDFSGVDGITTVGSASALSLKDDSINNDPVATPVGDRYNIVSCSTAGVIQAEASVRNFGFFYPDMGIMVFSQQELSASIPGSGSSVGGAVTYDDIGARGFATSTVVNANTNEALRFINCLKAPANTANATAQPGNLKFRDEEDQVSAQYFCRVRSGQMNFSNNPTFVSGSLNELRQSTMKGNPTTFISSVQLYNEAGDIVAVGNLSTPLKKNFSSEATIKVKLTY